MGKSFYLIRFAIGILVGVSGPQFAAGRIEKKPSNEANILTTPEQLCGSLLRVEPESRYERFPEFLRIKIGNKFNYLPRRWRPISRISVVVPIYRELDNGNIKRLVHNLSRQVLDPKKFQLVVVVNNSPSDAGDLHSSVYLENQRTLEYLRRVSAEFEIQIVDHSTKGIEKNMGLIRQKGFEVAVATAQVRDDEHVIVQMDGDTYMPDNYLAIVFAYYSYYDLQAVITHLGFENRAGDDPVLARSFFKYNTDLAHTLMERSAGYAALGAGSPQITSKASVLKELGGVPLVPESEDFSLMRKLREIPHFYTADAFTVTEDRARPDGYDAAARLTWTRAWDEDLQPYRGTILQALIAPRLYHLDLQVIKGKMSFSAALDQITKHLGQLLNEEVEPGKFYVNFADYAADLEERNRRLPPGEFYPIVGSWFPGLIRWTVTHYGRVLFDMVTEFVSRKERELLKMEYERRARIYSDYLPIRIRALSRIYRDRSNGALISLQRHPDNFLQLLSQPGSKIAEELGTYAQGYSSEAAFLSAAEKRYPDYLSVYNSTPFRQDYDAMEVLGKMYLRAQSHPDVYPTLLNFLEIFRGY